MALCRTVSGLWRACGPLLPGQRLLLRAQSSGPGPLEPLEPRTSLSHPPWPQLEPRDPELERRRHAAVVEAVNLRLQQRDFGRLFAVVHIAGRQWKVTDEDLIKVENHLEAECGDRIRMEKVMATCCVSVQ